MFVRRCKVSAHLKMLVELGKQIVDRPLTLIGLGQVFTEQPDRLSIGHRVTLCNTDKPHERQLITSDRQTDHTAPAAPIS